MGNTESHSCHTSCAAFIHHFTSLKFCIPFSENETGYAHYFGSVDLLNEQQQDYKDVISSDDSFDDHFTSLLHGLHLLDDFYNYTCNFNLKMLIAKVLYEVRLELHSLSGRRKNGTSLVQDLERGYTNSRNMMKNVLFNPETMEYDVSFVFKRFQRRTYSYLLGMFDRISEYISDANAPLMKEVEKLKEKLMLLEPLADYQLLYLGPLMVFIDKVICLLYPYVVDKKDEETTLAMMKKLTDLVENLNVKDICIAILTPSCNIYTEKSSIGELEFLNDLRKLIPVYAIIYRKGGSGGTLHEKLVLLETFIANLPRKLQLEKFNYFERYIEKITRVTIHILHSNYDKDMKEDMAREVNDALSQVIGQIEDVQAEVQVIKLYNHPKTDGLGFLDLFLEHLDELLKFQPEVIEFMKSQIESLYVDFDVLRDFLKKIKDQHDAENEEIRDLRVRISGLAYQVEYIIDFYLSKCAPDSRIMFSLTQVVEQTKLIKSEAANIYVDEKYHVAKIPSSVTSSQAIYLTTNEIVGFDNEAEKIREFLFGDIRQRDILSIVGLPGLGKTTLARKLYEEPLLIEHFHVRAWCTVSQTYSTRDLLLTLVGDLIKITEEINKMNDEDLAAKLYQSLKGRRYFIVIDDLWHVEAWNSLVRSLPNDENHSRILITSRLQNVAPQTKVGRKVHFLRELSDHESWELFQKKLRRPNENLSQEILQVGKQIAESCKGLPLAIVVIASLLEKMEKSVVKWKEIAENLSVHILSDTESQFNAIFELSYTNLPDHLKSCFLYFGAFAEDEEIPLCKLKWLWIAEGFVRNINIKTKSLEDVAEDYFLDLFSRSLVTSTKERSSGGGVKACRVHDLLRDFCLKKAAEESFLQVIHIDDGSDFSRVYDEHRLSILSKKWFTGKINPFGCSVRSLLQRRHHSVLDIQYLFENFKLLKVMDLGSTNIGDHFSKIELLIHLRYLAVTASRFLGITYIPSSISNLWNLQFLLVETIYGGMIVVPDSLWDMLNLRHVHINFRASFEVNVERFENSILLENLETLSTPWFSCKEDAENLLTRLPKLQKLRCIFSGDEDSYRHQYVDLNFLDQLTSLKVVFECDWKAKTINLNFPSNLKKLKLSNYSRSLNGISEIGRTLPNLEVLKLDRVNKDSTWFVDDGNFPKLKYLKIKNVLFFRKWIASPDSFPNLEKLVLEDCQFLLEIPPSFGEIQTLQMITVKNCNSDVDDSARRIQMEQQEEWQNDELKVYITPRHIENEEMKETNDS